MPSDRLNHVVDELSSEAEHLSARRDQIRAELKKVEAELERVGNAISTLSGKTKSGPSKRRSKGLTTDEIVEWIQEILSTQPNLAKKQLQKNIAERAKAAGRSRSGLHLRLSEALGHEQFAETSGKWSVVPAH